MGSWFPQPDFGGYINGYLHYEENAGWGGRLCVSNTRSHCAINKIKILQGRRVRPVQQSSSAANRVIFLSRVSCCHRSSHLLYLTTCSPAPFSLSTVSMQGPADVVLLLPQERRMDVAAALDCQEVVAVTAPSPWALPLLSQPVSSRRLFWFWQNTSSNPPSRQARGCGTANPAGSSHKALGWNKS